MTDHTSLASAQSSSGKGVLLLVTGTNKLENVKLADLFSSSGEELCSCKTLCCCLWFLVSILQNELMLPSVLHSVCIVLEFWKMMKIKNYSPYLSLVPPAKGKVTSRLAWYPKSLGINWLHPSQKSKGEGGGCTAAFSQIFWYPPPPISQVLTCAFFKSTFYCVFPFSYAQYLTWGIGPWENY